MKLKKRIISFFLVLALCIGMAPVSAFAETLPDMPESTTVTLETGGSSETLTEKTEEPDGAEESPVPTETPEQGQEPVASAESHAVTPTEPPVSEVETAEEPQPEPAPMADPEPEYVPGFTVEVKGGKYAWPVPTSSDVSQGYAVSQHEALDIAASEGDSVLAAEAGTISTVQLWDSDREEGLRNREGDPRQRHWLQDQGLNQRQVGEPAYQLPHAHGPRNLLHGRNRAAHAPRAFDLWRMLQKLYRRFDLDDFTDFSKLEPEAYPTMSDFYELLEEEYILYDRQKKNLFTEETIQEVCLGLNSMCTGAESKYFNGHTNIVDDKFLCFNVKGIMELNVRLRNALLFSILSYMTNSVLGVGNCAAVIDELYLFLTNLTAIEYIRNLMKRARKRESSVVIASQNIEDFLMDGVRELTKPLFAIPTHQFLFNAGQTEPRVYIDTLQLEEAEFELIRYPEKGTCLYRCGNERYLLQVIFPEFKKAMFGSAGGR